MILRRPAGERLRAKRFIDDADGSWAGMMEVNLSCLYLSGVVCVGLNSFF